MFIGNDFRGSELYESRKVTRVTADGKSETIERAVLKEHNMTVFIDGEQALEFNCTAEFLPELVLGRMAAENIIDHVDYHKEVVAACEQMLVALNPSFAKEKETDERLSKLEGGLEDIKTMLARALNPKK